MKRLFLAVLTLVGGYAHSQTLGNLTVEKIMRDPKWMGIAPENIRWSDDSKKVYFNWNPENIDQNATYYIEVPNTKPIKLGNEEVRLLPSTEGDFNKDRTQKVYEKNGDLFVLNTKTGVAARLTNTVEAESYPKFGSNDAKVLFVRSNNLYAFDLRSSNLTQLTNFVDKLEAAKPKPNDQDKWLKEDQLGLFDVLKEKEKKQQAADTERKAAQPMRPKAIPLNGSQLTDVEASPDGRFITYVLFKRAEGAHSAIVPNYVTTSGYTEDIPNRTKVGAPQGTVEAFVYDTQRDSAYAISTLEIPGIKDIPEYLKDYPKQLDERSKLNADRKVIVGMPLWSEDGRNAVVTVTAQDNKDRWIMKLDPVNGKLRLLDRQHDDAWIGGPGVSYYSANIGWINNNELYYQSEASGYSHISVVNVSSGAKRQLTSGKWEVQSLRLSNDKKTLYFSANMEHPGITHFYSIPVTGGTPLKLTSMKGGNEVSVSPDEKWLAIRYSYSNKPWELYLQPNKTGAKAVQVTNSTTAEFNSYAWREPEMVTFKNRYGTDVYARLYQPKTPHPSRPAVVFVHGAGYLQNVHYWWSTYFREYMFNNLLADNGYTVLDVDYTGSSGYGRDFRTGIYRHMGGKDLTDQVDGVKMLVEKYEVNPQHVGLYGGSYGGFITLMAMFTQPDVFASGAALRSVTDWAHYNHGYTSNILNEPYTDPKAYEQSSPINFAQGLKGNLLMLHGVVDQNVNFQDIVRLNQRLIELHKENWWLALYPVEDHGFVQPSSWTDEYKRIFKLFEDTLKK
ncbi:MAG: peptidase [Sphingobacteriaceae bacterium]|jgi:dipeptidyl aminopeptidase/acylaminoacyl peptidase|nr:peptidase [Sphingobacteriaceae bacterium]